MTETTEAPATIVAGLQDGWWYHDARGVWWQIAGRTRFYPWYVWATAGGWFERSTGQRVARIALDDGHGLQAPLPPGHPAHLVLSSGGPTPERREAP